MSASNLVLIGMPGVGKSTLGVLLAKATGRDFIDTDLCLQASEGRVLQDILEADGPVGFRAKEERQVLALRCSHSVVATGGSVVYSAAAMRHLKADGYTVYLYLPLELLRPRLDNEGVRGIVRVAGQSLEALFAERARLYQTYSDCTVDCAHLNHEQALSAVCRQLDAAFSG